MRQHFDYGHWYDLNKLQVKNIKSCQFVASMNHTAGSFHVNPRLQRHFVTFAIGFPGSTSLLTIYQTFLSGFLTGQGFASEIRLLTSTLIDAALQLHLTVARSFRKTATNFHYEFTVRHLSNVFQGLLTAAPEVFSEAGKFVQLWLHESERVYGDRLVDAEDLAKYNQHAHAICKRKFPQYNMAKFFADRNADALIFCHFAGSAGQESGYDRVEEIGKLKVTLETKLAEYNEVFAAMDLVLFEDAIKHVTRLSRIMRNPSGHALLVGVGGSGKQSLSRLAAFVCELAVRQLTITSNYSMNDFREALKGMCKW